MNQTTINQYKEKEIPKEEKIIKTTETTAQEDSKQFAEYRHLNIALNSIISEFNELIGLTDEALINIWPINPNNYRLYLKKGKDIFVFYNYIFNYYINNINNTLTAYLINDSFFVRDALFFYFINHFNSTSEKFLDITDEKKKNGILNEIFNLRVPKGGNEYLAIELQKKKINSDKLSGQKGGENDDNEPKTLGEAIIKVVTGRYINKINLKYNDTERTVEIGEQKYTTMTLSKKQLEDILKDDIYIKAIDEWFIEFNKILENYNNTGSAIKIDNFKTKIMNVSNNVISKQKNSLYENIKKFLSPPINPRIYEKRQKEIIKKINEFEQYINVDIISSIIRNAGAYKKIKQVGKKQPKSPSLSAAAKIPVNMILQKVCQQVNDIIDDENPIDPNVKWNDKIQENIDKGDIFGAEGNIINKVASGKPSTEIDTKLYDAFTEWINNESQYDKQSYKSLANKNTDWNAGSMASFFGDNLGTDTIYVINNALTAEKDATKMIKHLSDYRTGKTKQKGNKPFQIICPLSSIFDAQNSFGSCNFGLNLDKKNDKGEPSNRHEAIIIPDNMNVFIEGTNDFSISLTLNFKKDKSSTIKGTAVIDYTIIPGNNGKDLKGKYRVINETIKEIIRGEAITILSAKNAFENIFNRITSKLGMGSLNEHLMSPDNVWNIMFRFYKKNLWVILRKN